MMILAFWKIAPLQGRVHDDTREPITARSFLLHVRNSGETVGCKVPYKPET